MKAVGITKKFDNLGRVVIPKEYRDKFGFEKDVYAEIFADEGGVYVRKYEPGCAFCGEINGVVNFGNKKICKKCILHIKNGF